jgi:cytochrome P450
MIPPVWETFQELVPPEGDYIDGKYIPGGTRVATCVYGILRSKKIFDQDADLFRPERWLRNDDDELARMVKAGDIIFGGGKYSCLGKTVALLGTRKTIATVRDVLAAGFYCADVDLSVDSAL